MNLAELYKSDKLTISFELFPPKTDQGMANLWEQVEKLVECGPSFMTCTYGAGGSTRDKTLEVLSTIHQNHPQVPVASHLTCVGSTTDQLREDLRHSLERGINTIVALRGDPPKGQKNFQAVEGGLRYASELVALIRKEFPEFSIAVAGYPEKHPEAESPEKDLENLKRKVDAGADAVITQLFYDNEDFYRFRDQCEQAGIRVPIIPGVLPVNSLGQIRRFTDLCGSRLTPHLVRRLEHHGDDEEGQFLVGVYYAARQVEDLVQHGVPGIHFYVLNKSRAAEFICQALTLAIA
ncbi:MAG: methylenetetrahydrofolate reductase [NAD(P)H] [Candidatus Hydrogenedentes bacterium]|nr:methylenetetrahydrofolate reductase [NAD(P)H] [Candidatus Hydrogenedentota bacterium]